MACAETRLVLSLPLDKGNCTLWDIRIRGPALRALGSATKSTRVRTVRQASETTSKTKEGKSAVSLF
jgi:hypothetical protein